MHEWLRPITESTQEAAFLAAILSQPEDDAPRQIYADWLEEREDPKAEFIRIWYRVNSGDTDKELIARERRMRSAINQDWLAIMRAWEPRPPELTARRVKAWTTREGKVVPVDEVLEARRSTGLEGMLSALTLRTNLTDRHFLLMHIVDETYRMRSIRPWANKCSLVAELHLAEFASISILLRKDMGGRLPRVSTFQLYATLLTELGDFRRAMEICEQAIDYGLRDGTKSGFEGRIQRIKKRAGAAIGLPIP